MTQTEHSIKQTYPCLCTLALTGSDKEMKTRLDRQFAAMHVIPNEQESLMRFLKANSFVPEHITCTASNAGIKNLKDSCHEEFLSLTEASNYIPCHLCSRYPSYRNGNFDKERRLLAHLFRSPRVFMGHFPKFRTSVFTSCHMFVYTGGTSAPKVLVLPLFLILAKTLIENVNGVQFSDSNSQSASETLLRIRPALTKRFMDARYPFSYSDLEPVIRTLVEEFESTRYDLDDFESLKGIYKDLSSKKNALSAKTAAFGSNEEFTVLQKPWDVSIPGLILLGMKKIRAFSKEDFRKNDGNYESLMGDTEAIAKRMKEGGYEFFNATASCENIIVQEYAKQAIVSDEPLMFKPNKTDSKQEIPQQNSFFDKSNEKPSNKVSEPHREEKKDTVKQTVSSDNYNDDSEIDPLICTDFANAGAQSADSNTNAPAAAKKEAATDDAGTATSDNASETSDSSGQKNSVAAPVPESPYAAYVGGTRRCAKSCKRNELGILILTDEMEKGLFPPLESIEETIDFLRHVMPHEEWFAAEHAVSNLGPGIALCGGNGYHTAFIPEAFLTKTVCKVLFRSQSPKVVYTQSLPYIYSHMKGHGIYSTHHLISLPAVFYANEEWSPFSSYPDYDLYDELNEKEIPAPTGSSLLDLMGCYEKIYLALASRNETGQRRMRIAQSRYRHYELALGTMKGSDRYPGCAWYPREASTEEIRSFDVRGRFFEIYLTAPLTRYGKPLCDEEHFYFLMGVVSRIQRECFSKYPVSLVTMTKDYLVYYLPTKRDDDRAYFENLAAGEFVHVRRDMRTDPPSIKVTARNIRSDFSSLT